MECNVTGDLFFLLFRVFRPLLLWMAFAVLCRLPASAQLSPARFHYDATRGFPDAEVYDLLQDSKGFIWIATDDGVWRFDGTAFRQFTTAEGLTQNTVFLLEEDFLGRIWFMPFGGDLCYFKQDHIEPYAFNDSLARHLPGLRVARSLEVKEDGGLLIGYLSHGIVEVSPGGKVNRHRENKSGRNYMAEDHPGAGFAYGMYESESITNPKQQFTFRSGKIDVSTKEVDDAKVALLITGIRRRNGGWCFAMQYQLIEIDPAGKITVTVQAAAPISLLEDEDGSLWIGYRQAGVRRYFPGAPLGSDAFEEFYPGESIACMMRDREGGYWVAALEKGLYYISSLHTRCLGATATAGDKIVSLIPGRSNTFFVLWRYKGPELLAGNIIHPLSAGMQPGTVCNAMGYDSLHDELYIGTDRATYCYKAATMQLLRGDNLKDNCFTFSGDRIYAGSAWKVRTRRPGEPWAALGNSRVRCRPEVLYTDRSGHVWMGGLDGLYLVRDSALVRYLPAEPLLKSRILDICERSDGVLVLATQNNGILVVENETVRRISVAEGLPAVQVHAVSPGSGNTIWASTRRGICRIAETAEGATVQRFPRLDELLGGSGGKIVQDASGQVLIVSAAGLICFNPADEKKNNYPPPVYFHAVRVGDSLFDPAKPAALSYDRNTIRLSFAGLTYCSNGRIPYRYRLIGQHETWENTMQSTVELAGLAPGDYRFEVEAQNEDGVWSTKPATFMFTIYPPFWNTWWFYSLAALAVAGAVALFVWWRVKQVRHAASLKARALEFRQQALTAQMNPHFIFNTLNAIQTYVLKEDKTRAVNYIGKFSRLMRTSLEHVRERYIPLGKELDALRLYLELEAMRFPGRLHFAVEVAADIDQGFIHVPAMLIQPFAENAVRHGIVPRPEGGTVTVRLQNKNGVLTCEIEDDGIGRATAPPEPGHKSFGSLITEDRLRLLSRQAGTEFYFEIIDKHGSDGAPAGTTVRFAVPYVLKKETT